MSETAPQLRPSAAPAKQSPTDEPQKSLLTNIEQDQSLSLLFDVSRELTSILGRDELLQRIADRVKKLVNYHLFMVMLWNELTQQLECAFTRHYEEQFAVRLSVPLFKGITGHAAGTRLPVRVDDIRLDQRYIEFPHSDNVRSEMVIPLLLHDRLVGVLDLESTQLGAFTLEHERMLGIVGTYIAIALENSRLYELSRDRELAMESDLDTAREIQRQLLPQDKRAVPGSTSPPRTCPRGSSAATFTILFITEPGAWASRSATSPAKARRRRSTVRSPSEFFASTRRTIAAGRKKCWGC